MYGTKTTVQILCPKEKGRVTKKQVTKFTFYMDMKVIGLINKQRPNVGDKQTKTS